MNSDSREINLANAVSVIVHEQSEWTLHEQSEWTSLRSNDQKPEFRAIMVLDIWIFVISVIMIKRSLNEAIKDFKIIS